MRKYVSLLVIALYLCSMCMLTSAPVYAGTETLDVISDNISSGVWTYTGGATDYTNMNSDDGDTTVIALNKTTGTYKYWGFDHCSAEYSINSITLYVKARAITAAYQINQFPAYYDGSNQFVAGALITTSSTSYSLLSYTWTTNPKTGVAWTCSDIHNGFFGLKSAGSYDGYATYIYLSIDYDATGPTVSTSAASSVGSTTATLNGAIVSTAGATVDYRGFVWDTSSHPSITDNTTPPNGYSDNWTEAGSFSAESFSHDVTGLTSSAVYYVRAFAHNLYGWSYGDEIAFEPIHAPTVETLPATLISVAGARLNASVTSSGGQLADIQFAYDNVTRAAWGDYANYTTLVSDCYTSGDFPYADITGLTASTVYYFRVQITNDTGSDTGDELNFTSFNTVNSPTSITAIPTATTISLVWIKGSGASYTLVRYKTGTYPSSTSDGNYAYLGTGESVTVTGLTPGTTYYIVAYGKDGSTYSVSYAQTLATTQAYNSGTTSNSTITPPGEDSTWTQEPDSTKVSTIPAFGGLIDGVAESYHQPVNYIWYFAWMLGAVGVGTAVYIRGNFNIMLGVGSFIGIIGIGVWWYNIVAGAVVVMLGLIAVGWALIGLRRPGG